MIAGIPIFPVLILLSLLVFVAPLALVALIVYAVVKKRPSVIFGGIAVLALLAVMIGAKTVAVLGQQSNGKVSMSFDSGIPLITATTNSSSTTIGPGFVAVNASNPPAASSLGISIGPLVFIAIVALVVIRGLSRTPRAGANDEHRCGWGLGRFILVVLVVTFALRAWQSTKEKSAWDRTSWDRQQAEHAQRDAVLAHRHTAASAIQTPADMQSSIEQLWDQLNQPKIKLDGVERTGSKKMAAGSATMENRDAPSADVAKTKNTETGSSSTAESLARSAASLGRVLAEVSTIAQQMSDATRIVARTLGAGDQPIDKSESAVHSQPAAKTMAKTVAATKEVPANSNKTSVKPTTARDGSGHASSTSELNEKIGGDVPASKPRPAWVDEPQKQVGNVLRWAIPAGPYATPDECSAKMDELLKIATDNYVKHYIWGLNDYPSLTTAQDGSPNVTILNFRSATLDRMGIDLSYIRREIAKDEYWETVDRSVGPMKNLYTLVEFTPDVDRDLRMRWDEVRRESRLTQVGFVSGSILGLIGLVFGLLKVDTATKGYYTKRLFFGVPALVIVTVLILSPLVVAVLGRAMSYRP
jgi:hypothetical protein